MIRPKKTRQSLLAAAGATILVLLPAAGANAATTLDGPVGLGTASTYAVLGGATVTNTGPSVINGDVGLSPGTSITGLPDATVNGTVHQTDAAAAQAQLDLTTAYGVAASLTPIQSGLGDLTGLSLTPGVYSGGELAVTGALVLEGTAESVWVFQAASTLTVASGALITVTGGASACNVFWQVSSSATLDTGAQFVGTVMANASITARTAATVTGRLLARTGAVTLDTNTLTTPSGCSPTSGTVRTSPTMTSAAPATGTVGTDYAHTFTASGSPVSTFSVTGGTLPPGLTLDSASGLLSGRSTTPGTYTFSVTASNGTAPDASADYTVTFAAAVADVIVADTGDGPTLAESGSKPFSTALVAAILIFGGVSFVLYRRLRTRTSAD